MKTDIYRLSNGIRCVLQRSTSQVAYLGVTIGAGSRDEIDSSHGAAHLMEHMMFKGTKKRKPHHINSLLDNVGGELNAYTTKEETVVHATVLKRDISRAAELITDVVFNSILPKEEIIKEKNIVIDEINSYKDSPTELIYDDFEDMLFSGSSLGRNILGSSKSLRKIGQQELQDFHRENYTTDQIVFSIVANISTNRFIEICERNFGSIAQSTTNTQRVLTSYTPQQQIINKRTYQTHCVIGGRGYDNRDNRRVALALMINILGGASASSRLNAIIREKYALSYSVEAGYTSYSDTGVASIYFGTDSSNLDLCQELIGKELNNFRTKEISSLQMSRYKKQFIGQLLISLDSNESLMFSIGKSLLNYDKVDDIDTLIKRVEGVTPLELMECTNEIFGNENLSTLIWVNK